MPEELANAIELDLDPVPAASNSLAGGPPPLTHRQLRRLASDLGFPLDAGPADLDAAQWAGLFALLESRSTWEDGMRARRITGNRTS